MIAQTESVNVYQWGSLDFAQENGASRWEALTGECKECALGWRDCGDNRTRSATALTLLQQPHAAVVVIHISKERHVCP